MLKDLCFEIIDTCPNNCKFCSSNSCMTKNTIISLGDFKMVIDYFMENGGIEELSLSGGEPFLHPDLFDMVKYSKSKGIRTVIFTSGVKMRIPLSKTVIDFYTKQMERDIELIRKNEPWNDRAINNIKRYYDGIINPPLFSCITEKEFKCLKDIGLDKIVFDYQGYEYDTDRYLTGRDELKRQCLLDSLLKASFSGLDTDVHFVPMKPNYKEIGDILETLEIAGIGTISILKFVPQGRGFVNREKLMLSQKEMNEFMSVLEREKSKFSGNIRIGIPLQGQIHHKCNAGLEKLDIKYDGTILPCPAFKELDIDTMNKFGIKFYSIYENLREVRVCGGTRVVPLCQKVYKL